MNEGLELHEGGSDELGSLSRESSVFGVDADAGDTEFIENEFVSLTEDKTL